MRAASLLFLSLAAAAPSFAETPTVRLRMAAIAPDGVAWVRVLKSFSREIEAGTEHRVTLKWYWGGIAGDELAVLDRIKRDQLDGQAGAQFCDRLAPSLRVARVLGMFQGREETSYVLGRLRGIVDAEFRKNGFLGFVSTLGNDILFSREPVRTLAELRKSRPWLWNLDQVMDAELHAIGLQPVLLPVLDAERAYEEKRLDGFVAVPNAALAFQWSSHARYFTDLRLGFLPACLVFSNRAIDALAIKDQQVIREAAAKLAVLLDDLNTTQDHALLYGLFAKQGLTSIPASETFRSEFFAAAREARARIDEKLVPKELIGRVESWLADFRAEHR